MCWRRNCRDRAVVAVPSLELQLPFLHLSTLGSPDTPRQYALLDRRVRLVCATGVSLSAKKAGSSLVHERLAERWQKIWVGLRTAGALLGRMIETALPIDALSLCLIGE